MEKKVVWACLEELRLEFVSKGKARAVDDWADHCHLRIAATLERSNNLERRKGILTKKEEKKKKKEVARLTKSGRGKFGGDARGAPCCNDWCLGLML